MNKLLSRLVKLNENYYEGKAKLFILKGKWREYGNTLITKRYICSSLSVFDAGGNRLKEPFTGVEHWTEHNTDVIHLPMNCAYHVINL